MEHQNLTKADAFLRISQAEFGSGVDASEDFLLALGAYLDEWQTEVNRELSRRCNLAKIRAEEEADAEAKEERDQC